MSPLLKQLHMSTNIPIGEINLKKPPTFTYMSPLLKQLYMSIIIRLEKIKNKEDPTRRCTRRYHLCPNCFTYHPSQAIFSLLLSHIANEGPVRIQYKCLVPIYVYAEMKLLGLGISKTDLQCSVSLFPHSCICEQFIFSRDRSAYFAAAKQADRSCEYLKHSQIHEVRIGNEAAQLHFCEFINWISGTVHIVAFFSLLVTGRIMPIFT